MYVLFTFVQDMALLGSECDTIIGNFIPSHRCVYRYITFGILIILQVYIFNLHNVATCCIFKVVFTKVIYSDNTWDCEICRTMTSECTELPLIEIWWVVGGAVFPRLFLFLGSFSLSEKAIKLHSLIVPTMVCAQLAANRFWIGRRTDVL